VKTNQNFIQTFTGKKFWPLDPDPADIDIQDIAHALSLQCRWTGHCREFYSVAQHSCLVSDYSKDKKWGLLHDASEAYLIDLARPVKKDERMAFYQAAEEKIMVAVAEKFGLKLPIPADVHQMDNKLLMTERRDLLVPMEWTEGAEKMAGTVETYESTINPWRCEYAEKQFLLRYQLFFGGVGA
jgi:hypothetical protein